MKTKPTTLFLLLIYLLASRHCAFANIKQTNVADYNRQEIASALGWVSVPQAQNICRGYFKIVPIKLHTLQPAPSSQNLTTFSAQGPSELSLYGRSVLRGKVTVTQPGRQITADTAYVYRDKNTRRIDRIETFGHVHIRTPDHLIISDRGSLDLRNNFLTLTQLIYHIIEVQRGQTVNGWGKAVSATRTGTKIINLRNASYSSCPPNRKPTWQVHAHHLRIDQNKKHVTAINSWVTLKGIPILYTPYLSFSYSRQRKSGFLTPTFGYSNTSGLQIGVPYYFNLAPNYDTTLTATLYSKRGVLFNDLFRYLTKRSRGQFQVYFIPQDHEFAKFKRNAPNDFSPSIPGVKRALDQLSRDSDNRFFIAYQNNTQYNAHWSNSIDANYASDAYFLQDFGNSPYSQSKDQLLNQAKINYNGLHWYFLGMLQLYQTLHTLNNLVITNQYSRLPELDLNGNFPHQAGGLDYRINSQFVYFDEANNFITGKPVPTGARFHVDPVVSLPIVKPEGFFTPTLQLQTTAYILKNPGTQIINPSESNPSDPARAIPVFDIDTGLFLQRTFHLFKHTYTQIIEPRLFYLYVPFVNQNSLPIFDTVLPTFNFSQLFVTNRFTGFDRIGDANQLSVALISHIVDPNTGEQKLSFGIGEMLLFQPHRVCLTASCSDDPTHDNFLSPLISQFSYHMNRHWGIVTNNSFDPYDRQLVNTSAYLNYVNTNNRVISIGYNYIRNGDLFPLSPINTAVPVNNLNQLDVGFAWPLSHKWSMLGSVDYNFSRGHPLAYFGGFQYSSCCWALRFIGSRTLIGQSTSGHLQFDNTFYIQIQLRGLGSYSNNDAESLLESELPGYVSTMQ